MSLIIVPGERTGIEALIQRKSLEYQDSLRAYLGASLFSNGLLDQFGFEIEPAVPFVPPNAEARRLAHKESSVSIVVTP